MPWPQGYASEYYALMYLIYSRNLNLEVSEFHEFFLAFLNWLRIVGFFYLSKKKYSLFEIEDK